jgi:hypothetical protein
MEIPGRAAHAVAEHVDEQVPALLRAVEAALETTDPPRGLQRDRQLEEYVGDLVAIAFNGSERERVELLARLLHLCAAGSGSDDPAEPYRWLARLDRLLRGWDGERRRAVAAPRPDQTEFEEHAAMLRAARAGVAPLRLDAVALETAELTAIHVLSGGTSVESALAAIDELTPLLDAARYELLAADDELGEAFRRPGATLALLEQLAWEGTRLLDGEPEPDERRWLSRLLLDVAAALLFAHDVHDRRGDHDESWWLVRDRAVEAITIGRLADAPQAVDAHAAIDLARAVAVTLAGHWLDEARGEGEDRVSELRPRVLDACGRCLVAAWAQRRIAAAAERLG